MLRLMKFAILGTDPDILQLAAAARSMGHEFVWLGDVRAEDAAAVRQLVADPADRASDWELLLDRRTADGILVGRGAASADLRGEQLKRLAVEGVPLLVMHPIFDSVLLYYEIDMTRREANAVIQHFNPLANHPAAPRLAEWVRVGHPAIGTIHQLTCERPLPSGARAVVLAALARDVELLAAVAGDIRWVSAIGPATMDASFASLQTQITAANVPSLRWSVGVMGASNAGLRLTLLGERGAVTLCELRDAKTAPNTWQLETAVADHHTVEPIEAFDPATATIQRLAAAIVEQNGETRAALSTWESATRAMEVVDAVELSLQKGRTIEVFQQQLTERLAFRGMMAALGCGLLLIAFLAVVAIAVLGGAEGMMREKIAPAWPLLLLAVLAFFLLLQAIPLLGRKPRGEERQRPKEPRAGRG
jgi:predicted dehydrogenase